MNESPDTSPKATIERAKRLLPAQSAARYKSEAAKRAERIGALLSSLVAADMRFLSLGTRLQSLAVRGKAANTYALTVEVQGQLHNWIDPILNHLKDAEAASHGVGPLLNGLVHEPLAWEVDTRLAIRSLRDHLVGFIDSNGGTCEEEFVNGGVCKLYSLGQRLQAMHEALLAELDTEAHVDMSAPAATEDTAPAPTASPMPPPKTPPTPSVVLCRRGEPCMINGKQKPALTDGQHAVVEALIAAGEEGLKKDSIQGVRASALRMLDDLRADADWAAVIVKPGKTNGRYRIR